MEKLGFFQIVQIIQMTCIKKETANHLWDATMRIWIAQTNLG